MLADEARLLCIQICQLQVGFDVNSNKARIMAALDGAASGDILLFPEAMLSGYAPHQENYSRNLCFNVIKGAMEEIGSRVRERGCCCIYGTAFWLPDGWRNTVVVETEDGRRFLHHKVELSTLDRAHFRPGPPAGPIDIDQVRLGVLACRELLFPTAWLALRNSGAKLLVHVNNAIQPKDKVWETLLAARAIELSCFAASVNNAAAPQALASFLIDPSGQIIARTACQQEEIIARNINLQGVVLDLKDRTDF